MENCNGKFVFFQFLHTATEGAFPAEVGNDSGVGPFFRRSLGLAHMPPLPNVRNHFYEHCVLSTRIRWNFYDFLRFFFLWAAGVKFFFSLLVVFCRHCSRKFVVLFFFVSQQNYLETLDCASPHRLLRRHAHKAYYAILCLLLCSWFFSSVTSGFCFVLFLLAKKERCPCEETKSTLVFG